MLLGEFAPFLKCINVIDALMKFAVCIDIFIGTIWLSIKLFALFSDIRAIFRTLSPYYITVHFGKVFIKLRVGNLIFEHSVYVSM